MRHSFLAFTWFLGLSLTLNACGTEPGPTLTADSDVVDVQAPDTLVNDAAAADLTWDDGAEGPDGALLDVEEVDGSDGGGALDTGDPDVPEETACLEASFLDGLSPVISGTCVNCHVAEGWAGGSGLVFASPGSGWPSTLEQTNLAALLGYLETAALPAMLVEKPTGAIGHGGGIQLLPGSPEAERLAHFVAQFEGAASCEPITDAPVKASDLLLASPVATLMQGARLIIDRRPSEAETTLVHTQGEAGLTAAFDAMMAEGMFARRIAQIVEDTLHTNTWRSKHDAFWIMRAWGLLEDNQGNTRGNYRWMDAYDVPQSDLWKALLNASAYGFSRSAKELVRYVVAEGKDFGEILTAPYTMMNPYSVRVYAAEALITGSLVPAVDDSADREHFEPVVLDLVPTAGLLTDINFLATYPTDPVNLHRNRSREVHDHFLATDILGLAERTAVAFGTNAQNPTMNDTNCLVCHTTMDPVAGAFQNWPRKQQQGFYNPDHPDGQARWESEDPDDQLRAPGLNATLSVPDGVKDQSLQWLGAQIIEDRRFSLAITEMMFRGLTGHTPLRSPRLGEDDYGPRLRAWQFQRGELEALAKDFFDAGRNIRVLVGNLLRSPLVRTLGLSLDNGHALRSLGLDKMPHPEDLERKLRIATGYAWLPYVQKTPEGVSNYHWNNHIDRPEKSLLTSYQEACGTGHGCYAKWYGLLGGLDINPVAGNDVRLETPNSLVGAIFVRLGVEMAMRLVPREFAITSTHADGTFVRRLFPMVDIDTVPQDEAGVEIAENVDQIVANIQHLHRQILSEDLPPDHPEIQATFQLFMDAWNARPENPRGQGFSGHVDANENATLAAWEAAQGLPVLERRVVDADDGHIVWIWRVILDYMLTDVRFLYDQLDEEDGL